MADAGEAGDVQAGVSSRKVKLSSAANSAYHSASLNNTVSCDEKLVLNLALVSSHIAFLAFRAPASVSPYFVSL